jgi:gluconolactonase
MEFATVSGGMGLIEGPVAMKDGSVLLVSQSPDQLIRVRPSGAQEVVAELGGGPNGAAIGPDGAAYICNNGGSYVLDRGNGGYAIKFAPQRYRGGAIQRVDLKTGAVSILYDSCDGKPLVGPNDIVFDRKGGFWFTDSGRPVGDLYHLGALYYALPDGSRIVCARSKLIAPNGVGLSPDEKTVYWADTFTARLFAAEIRGPGEIEIVPGMNSGRVLHTVEGNQVFDSMAVEADGRICIARPRGGGIRIVETSGAWDDVAVPYNHTTNLCFGGPDMRDVWITAAGSGSLLKCRWPRPGHRLAFEA